MGITFKYAVFVAFVNNNGGERIDYKMSCNCPHKYKASAKISADFATQPILDAMKSNNVKLDHLGFAVTTFDPIKDICTSIQIAEPDQPYDLS